MSAVSIYHRPGMAEEHLAWRYGPSWPLVVAVIDTIRGATPEQIDELAAAGDAAWSAARDAAWSAARDAARAAAWSAAWSAARAAAGDAAWAAAWSAAWSAARDAAGDAARDAAGDAARAAAWSAARAAAVHDLVGQHGYTAEHEQTLLAPYAAVFGQPWST